MKQVLKKGRIGIIFPWAKLDSVPSLCNAAELFAEEGYAVDIYTKLDDDFVAPVFNSNLIEIIPLLSRRERTGIHKYLPRRLNILKRHIWNRYCCFIGVDPEGLIETFLISRLIPVPVVYFSLELLLCEELCSEREKQIKQKEIAFCRKVKFIIIQDEARAELLAKENNITMDRFVMVPNSPLGPARRSASRYWHDRFGLKDDCKVVLHAGSLEKWTGIDDIVNSVRKWPDDWVLVIHSRSAESSESVERLRRQAPPGRIYFSLKPVSHQQFDQLIDGADIGIAFYLEAGSAYTQTNIKVIGLSSGKIAYYFRSGLPLIVNNSVSVSNLVKDENCGIVVENYRDIGDAITQIDRDYEKFADKAHRVFDKYMDFSDSFAAVVERIEEFCK